MSLDPRVDELLKRMEVIERLVEALKEVECKKYTTCLECPRKLFDACNVDGGL